MLTEAAYRERKWGEFPSLQKLIEKKPMPINFYGLSSNSDNPIAFVGRMIEIAIVCETHVMKSIHPHFPDRTYKAVY